MDAIVIFLVCLSLSGAAPISALTNWDCGPKKGDDIALLIDAILAL